MVSRAVTFLKLSEVSFYEALNSIGVYVIWDSRSTVRPTYIGEGGLVKRLSQWESIFAEPLDGYIALLGHPTEKNAKTEAQAIETLLLQVGAETNRSPIHNAHPGHFNIIKSTCKSNNKLKVYFKGYDPFAHPHRSRKMDDSKCIIAEYDTEIDDVNLVYTWRTRS